MFSKAVLRNIPNGHQAYKLSSRKRQKEELQYISGHLKKWEAKGAQRDHLIRELLAEDIDLEQRCSGTPSSEENLKRC